MSKQGKCTNWGGCKLADEGSIQEISNGIEFVCQECGEELTKVGGGVKPPPPSNRTRIFLLLTIGVILIIGIVFGGYTVYKIWQYKNLINLLTEAINIEDISQAEEVFKKLNKLGEIDERCPECVQKFEDLLLSTFEKLLQEENFAEAQDIIAKIQALGKPDLCSDCEQRISEAEKIVPYRKNLALHPVEAGSYELTEYLKRYLIYLETDPVIIGQSFSIQAGEVTVGEFRTYVESLDEVARSNLGTRWEQDDQGNKYPDTRPVENISWQEANNYAKWLSEKTKWNLQLPTRQQWAAACVKYPDPQPILGRIDDKESEPLAVFRKDRDIDHLLGNLREWATDSCEEGRYYLLGENYMTDPTDPEAVGKPNCAKDEKWAGVGFRLVRIEK